MPVNLSAGRPGAFVVAGSAIALLLATAATAYRAGPAGLNSRASASPHVAVFGRQATARAPLAPAPAADPVLIGAGDICVTRIIGSAVATAKIVERYPSAQVFTLGDNSNEKGTTTQYRGCYARAWGQFLGRTRAVIGNHDCTFAFCAAYYQYFGAAAGPAFKGYYSYDLPNDWHVVVLNSQGEQVGGTGSGSPEESWLRADLAANKGKHLIAMWHIPVFATGQPRHTDYLAFWNDLYAAHADLILNGHDHVYERFALQAPSGKADRKGIREIVVGTGGAFPQTFGRTIAANSQVRHTGTFGVLQLTLHPHSYSWRFIPIAGGTFTDSGTQATHT
jgi:hypothetical protein